jgi:hypothetical protein
MAVVVPIVSTFNNKGVRSAITEISKAEGAMGKMSAATKIAGFAMAGAATAAGAFALKVGVDAVKAAAEEQAAVEKLNTTLKNLGFGAASEEVQKFIDDTQFATGVADDQLRPAMDRLVRSGLSVAEAQTAMGIALDASAGSGKSLMTVVNAMGRGYEGSTTALGKLGLGLDAATLKSGNMRAITDTMSRTFSGQAATAANSYSGQLARVKIGLDELQESLGAGLLEGFSDAMGGTGDSADGLAQSLRDLQPVAELIGSTIGDQLGDLGKFLTLITKITGALDDLSASSPAAATGLGVLGEVAKTVAGGPIYSLLDKLGKVTDALGVTGAAAEDTAAAIAGVTGAGTYFGGTPTAGYDDKYFADARDSRNAAVKSLIATQKAAKAAAKSLGGSDGGLSASAKLAQERFDTMKESVDDWRGRLETASEAVDTAKAKLADYAQSMATWISSGVSFSDAFRSMEDSVKAAAESDGKVAAISWTTAFAQQITDQKAAIQAVRDLMGTLNPNDTLGNKLLLDQLMGLDPAQAKIAADDMVKNKLGPAYAASLSENFGAASQLGTDVATVWYGQGVQMAESSYEAIKATLEGKLGALYAQGKSMGQAVMDGYNSAIKGLPADVRVPGGKNGRSGNTVNVQVTAGVGNPVEIARTIENVLRTRDLRLGQ